MPRPTFRRACSEVDGPVTSMVKALPYASYASYLSGLALGPGFRANLTAYAFRRGAAQVINKIMTPAERNQVMGHSRSSIFERFYQNHVVGTDVAAAVLKIPSRSSLIASIGHIGIDRDPRAPLRLDPKEQASTLADERLLKIQDHIKELRARRYNHAHQSSERWTIMDQRACRLAQLKASSLRRKLLREATTEKRRTFFEDIDNDDIRKIKDGVHVTFDPSLPVYALQARRNVASIFNGVSQSVSQPERRMEVLQNFIELCHVRESHHKNSASKASKAAAEEVRNQDGA